MLENFEKAFKIVLDIEGKESNDPRDPGGYTKFGLSSKFNPSVNKNTTIAEAKEIYRKKYWGKVCDDALFPMDICLFDGMVNPQLGGNNEILEKNPGVSWSLFLLLRMLRYMKVSKDIHVKGHLFRCLKLCQAILDWKNPSV